jgi:hypothetical protein
VNRPAPIPAEAEASGSETDWFKVQGWMVGEIILAHQILGRKINNLRTQNQGHSAVAQKLAAEEVGRLAGQLKTCADIVARQSAEYLKRKPRP